MRILYVITQGEQGGAQLYVKTLAQAKKAEKHEVYVAIGEVGDNYLAQELAKSGIKVLPLKRLKRAISPLNDMLGIIELARLYNRISPETIHLNSTKAGVIGSFAAAWGKLRSKNCRVIYTVHGWVFNEAMSPLKKWLYKSLERLTAKYKDNIICVSEYDRWVALAEKIAPAEKLVAIHNGIDLGTIDFLDRKEARKKLLPDQRQSDQEIIIGVIANFYPTKGLEYLIGVVKTLITDYKLRITAIIIGDGELRQQLEQQIKQLKLENDIILAGKINDARSYLKALDIAVMPSVKEGFPYFLLEAMAAGLPIVATKVGGIPEIIQDNETGFLTEPKNISKLAERVKTLAENADLRTEFGQAGLARVKKEFSQNQMIRETSACYK